jgi:hypothetical protein
MLIRPDQVTIEIEIAPHLEPGDGGAVHGDRYEVRLGDQVLVTPSRQPFLDAARRLIELGYPFESMLVMRHVASGTVSLRSTIGAAAKLKVGDNTQGSPRLRPLRQKTAAAGVDAAPPASADGSVVGRSPDAQTTGRRP